MPFRNASCMVEDGTTVFKLSELHELYAKRLADFGLEKQINRTRLKDDILFRISCLHDESDGKNTLLVNSRLRQLMKDEVMSRDYDDDDSLILAKTDGFWSQELGRIEVVRI